MHRSTTWIRGGLLLALAIAVVAGVTRRSGTGTGLLPAIGGDTWPPVPVKDTGPA